MEEIEFYIDATVETMDGAIKHLNIELSKIRAGKAHTSMLDGLTIDYYGMQTPISGAASITTPDARTIAIKPFEKGIFGEIEKAIRNSNLGLNPMNDGELIRLSIPPLTEERRKELYKKAAAEGEHSKVAIRNIRRDTIEQVKKMQKNGLSEDTAADAEREIQDLTNKFIALVEKTLAAKEKEVMSV